MSIFTAAASDEDGDTISALRAENEQLRQALIAMHDTLEMTARAGASYASANEVLRDTVIRWASRAEQAEDMLEAIGAGGVGKQLEQPDIVNPTSVPAGWKLVPIKPTNKMAGEYWKYNDRTDVVMRDAWDAMLAAAPQPPVVEQEPVAWQYRMRPDWGSKKDCWGPWQDCTKEQAAMYQRVPLLHDWAYESRQLYTHPQPTRQPLTDAQIQTLADAHMEAFAQFIGAGEVWFEGEKEFARAIEAAHGIGGEA